MSATEVDKVLVDLGGDVTTVGDAIPMHALLDKTMNVTDKSVAAAKAGVVIAREAAHEAETDRILEQKATLSRISS